MHPDTTEDLTRFNDAFQQIASDPAISFDLEDVIVIGDRAIVLWRLRFGATDEESVRDVNLMRVRDGKIVEALGYVKGS
jgi:ketosteroid isomerase-like protein